jgi:hypothetical protein
LTADHIPNKATASKCLSYVLGPARFEPEIVAPIQVTASKVN